MVFRPATYPFPPSRGRRGFELDANGQLRNFGIGADDRTVESQGNWRLDSQNHLTLRPAGSGAATTIRLVHVGPDKLVAKK